MENENTIIQFGEKKWKMIDGKEYSYYDSIFGIRVEVIDEKKFDRTGLLKLHGVNTYKPTYILLSTWTIKKGIDKVKEVLTHECVGHYFQSTYYNDRMNKFWSGLVHYAELDEHCVTKYARPIKGDKWKLRNERERQAETLAYGYTYIEQGKELPKKAIWNDKIQFQFDLLKEFTESIIRKHFK